MVRRPHSLPAGVESGDEDGSTERHGRDHGTPRNHEQGLGPEEGLRDPRRGFTRWPLPAFRWLPLVLASLPMLLFLVVPLVALVLRVSLGNLLVLVLTILTGTAHSDAAQALALSIDTTLVATGITVVLGTPLAYLLARRRFFGHTVADALVDLPVVLPPAVAGIALLVSLGRNGVFGPALAHLGIALPFTSAAVVLAQIFVAAPFYIRAAINAFSAIRRELEEAAAIDGAGSWGVFTRITLPLALPALASGMVMTWARALGEFGATIIFAGNFPGRTQTIPLAIYLGFEIDLDTALTLAALQLALAFSIVLVVRGILRRALSSGE